MLMLQRLMRPFLMLLFTLFIPAMSFAAIVNLREQPTDQSKIIGTADLSAGIIPIYTPRNSLWIKIADPSNGNTGWIKSSELKDSKGNVITYKQQISSGDNSQSIQMMQTSGTPLTPEQNKNLELQMQQQEMTAKETLMKAQKSISEVMEGLQKLYQQQIQIMQQSGGAMMPAPIPQQQNNYGTQPARPQRGSQPMQSQPSFQQQGMQPSFPAFPPEPERAPQGQQRGNPYATQNQMQQPANNSSGGY